MRVSTKTLIGVAALASLMVGTPLQARQSSPTTQPSHQQHHPEQQSGAPGKQGQMTMSCQDMMVGHQKMMDEMKATDAKLDSLVQTMNSAAASNKIDATAAVVTELVTERRAMRDRMGGMQTRMMQHMMEHMSQGGTKDMMQCPMLKQMGGSMR